MNGVLGAIVQYGLCLLLVLVVVGIGWAFWDSMDLQRELEENENDD